MGDDARARAARLLARTRDVIDERATGDRPPAWCDALGYTRFLDALSDDEVTLGERDGLGAVLAARPDSPAGLTALAREVEEACALPPPPLPAALPPMRGASDRKVAQIARLVGLLTLRAPRARIVDVGAGHGQLTRALASLTGLPTIGWERDAGRVAVARARAGEGGPAFVERDAAALQGALRPSDVVVGLHACGAVGEIVFEAAGRVGAGVVWVGCCPQKRQGPRAPMSRVEGVSPGALTLPRSVLGLANVRRGDEGVEEDLATRGRARLSRIALGALLSRAGIALAPGEEMRGLNRRRATGRLDDLARAAFGLRGLPPPSDLDVAEATREAEVTHARRRRWELPRTMLGRLVEVWIAHDRAGHLAALGRSVEVRRVFDERESPRDVVVLSAPRAR
ncbi:MAG: methyltransferase [Polyangiaceae bacterium]|nr:methyltransferase [Polyangiaceae bacterium]